MNNIASQENLMRFFQVQQFLNYEASLLDSWQLDTWFELFTEDGAYFVPPTDVSAEEADPAKHLYYIADNHARLKERVIRLEKKTCHAEFPRSKVQHLVSNILLLGEDEQGRILASAAFVIYRTKNGQTDMFVGNYRYVLDERDGNLKIARKVCNLALDGLRPQAKISIIL
ncbi:aromatic-ring-hydroxylating dioxygenase subunit beta [Zhongshania aliphaticivorans]|uniref:Aromatic-ring-hydroxylating dioxygenase subunit beta n=1 Tax=Zhongshania aliphaticivorans TaxID=1470434 RepID=A0A127M2N3_9GAMM|nr:aromatic-ring-hydroxylating dioxygenase subunit beta [Zhongshania aliphaticivorans]AMO67488.1 aromatic-ring-hydroxylating dioxygenase subunit beta [Zhongshania aliphaticivorans]